tara:strand:+ start:249 stop:443 length:195 start_codon:yes stop_codon:yes gene_type:complete
MDQTKQRLLSQLARLIPSKIKTKDAEKAEVIAKKLDEMVKEAQQLQASRSADTDPPPDTRPRDK